MRALITRPEEDAASLAAELRKLGIEPVIEPMLTVELETGDSMDLAGVQALLFTSANGVREFSRRETRRDLPVYAVGDATARAARAAGFGKVVSAGRDAEALAKLVAAEVKPADGVLLHPRGRDTTGHLETALRAAGFDLREPVVYRAEAARSLSPSVRKMLGEGGIELALFFSPRTARNFAALARDAKLGDTTRNITAACLSKPVAEALAPLVFGRVIVAPQPNQDSLLAALPKPTRVRRSRHAWLYAAAALVVVAAALFVFYNMRPIENRTPPQPSTIAAAPTPPLVLPAPVPAPTLPQPPPVDLKPLEDRLAALEQRVARIPPPQPASPPVDLKPIEDRLAALEARRVDLTRAELLVAVGQLREVVNRGAAYAAALETVAALAKAEPEVQSALGALTPNARVGIPTAAQLVQRFDREAAEIVRADLAPEGAHWTDRLLARLSSLVSVRRTGADVEGNTPSAIVARAEAKVKSGDLAGAVAELDKLAGKPAEAAQPWLVAAKARLAVDGALDSLGAYALRQLGQAR
jgi:uroporphyrinogen-III synthase